MSKNYYIIPIFVPHEGCPHDCVFCNQERITGLNTDSHRLISKCSEKNDEVTESTVRKTIDEYLETIDRKNATLEVSFFGGTFTGIRESKQKELLSVAKEYKEKNLIDKIRLSTRPDYINEHILDYLKYYNVDIIELGVQSLNEEVLKKSSRGHGVQEVIDASKLIKSYGFVLGHQIMPGLPGDTFEKDIETTKMSIAMQPDICRIYPSLVIKDTAMEIMYNRGEYIPYTLDEAVEISKKMYEMYSENNVTIIRVGLQPTETINENKDVVAGPFHPAFRELVESSLLVDKILNAMDNKESFEIHINPKDISKLYANKKVYFNILKENKKQVTVKQDINVPRGKVKLYFEDKTLEITY